MRIIPYSIRHPILAARERRAARAQARSSPATIAAEQKAREQAELLTLKRQLARSGGVARVLVEPFFHESAQELDEREGTSRAHGRDERDDLAPMVNPGVWAGLPLPRDTAKARAFTSAIRDRFANPGMPLIVLSDQKRVHRTRTLMEPLREGAHLVGLSGGAPHGDWEATLKKWTDAGLTKVVLGGKHLEHEDRQMVDDHPDFEHLTRAGLTRGKRIPWDGQLGRVLRRFAKHGIEVELDREATYATE